MRMLPRSLPRLHGFSPKVIGQGWKSPRRDGSTALVVFVATVGFAPHVGMGVVVGAAVALAIYRLPWHRGVAARPSSPLPLPGCLHLPDMSGMGMRVAV